MVVQTHIRTTYHLLYLNMVLIRQSITCVHRNLLDQRDDTQIKHVKPEFNSKTEESFIAKVKLLASTLYQYTAHHRNKCTYIHK